MKLDIGRATHTGLQREHNEDAMGMVGPGATEDGWLLAVADGMGGHLAGEVASQTAIETLLREYALRRGQEPGLALVEAARAANRAVWEAGQSDPSRAGMGTTLVAALVRDGRLLVAHVGDSPAVMVHQGQARQLTRDHSWVAEAVARGHLDREQAERHPYRHVLTRALGSQPDVQVDLSDELPLGAGDVLVLCSDGLVRHVSPDELPALVRGRSAQQIAEALVALANERGGEDNITVIVCRVLA